MKKISLNGISKILSDKELKNVMGGSGTGNCAVDSIGLCGGNCQRPGGAAGKCKPYKGDPCTCA